MPLPQPRAGAVLEDAFATQADVVEMSTIGDPEAVVWSSIMQLTAAEVADKVLAGNHNVRQKADRKKIARNMAPYLHQAFQFYKSAIGADARTAPLLHYYAALNLAKALIEIKNPVLHKRPENYRHGISWRPNRGYLVNLDTEFVSVASSPSKARGIWHLLWEVVVGKRFLAKKPVRFRVAELFGLCPEITVEFERSFEEPSRTLFLCDPAVGIDNQKRQVWISFEIWDAQLQRIDISAADFIMLVSHYGMAYRQVACATDDRVAFELKRPRRFRSIEKARAALDREFKALNLFTAMNNGKIEYVVPYERFVPRRLPQLIVLYTVLFWLGSLVRYDPHSVRELQDSEYWVLIDGFMNQSRIWLVELFEMHLYRIETHLASAR